MVKSLEFRVKGLGSKATVDGGDLAQFRTSIYLIALRYSMGDIRQCKISFLHSGVAILRSTSVMEKKNQGL